MNTRVSWIDETHLQTLLARLDAPEPEEQPVESTDVATLPDADAAEAPQPFFAEETAGEAPQTAEDEFPPLAAQEDEDPYPEESAPLTVPEAAAPETAPPSTPAAAEEESTSPPLDRIRERLRLIRHRAAEAGILSHSMPAADATTAATLTPEARLAAYARRALAALPADARLTILDAEGAIVWNNDPKPGLVLSKLMAMKAARHASIATIADHSPVICHELPPDHFLTVFSEGTSGEQIQIAIKTTAPLDEAGLETWRHTF